MKNHINVHPGELLREEFLVPMGITAYRQAAVHPLAAA
jgi:plasmid maintenance system antidote protein VapI